MDDTISRHAAINMFEPWLEVEGYTERERNVIGAVVYGLKHLPFAEPEPQWIPCSERQPEDNGYYLITGYNGLVSTAFWESQPPTPMWRTKYWPLDVIAWMPLPEPYKGSENMIKLKKSKKVKELERQIESLHVINAELTGRAIKAEQEMDRQRSERFHETQQRFEFEQSRDRWRVAAIFSIILATVLAVSLMISISADASEAKRYTTQKVNLFDKVKGEKVYSVSRNTRVRLIKEGHTWARIRYKGRKLSVRKKYLNAESLPSKERSKYYIRYLRTRGPVYWRGRKYTYYTSRLCPIWLLPVPGLHVDKNGFWCDKKDYIVLGSSVDNKIKRTVYATPFGKFGKVYDTGGYSTPSWLCDTAVTW